VLFGGGAATLGWVKKDEKSESKSGEIRRGWVVRDSSGKGWTERGGYKKGQGSTSQEGAVGCWVPVMRERTRPKKKIEAKKEGSQTR